MRQFTFTGSGSTDVTTYKELSDLIPPERADVLPSVVALRVAAQSEDSSGSAVIRFVMATRDRVLFYKDVTATIGTVRTAHAGSSGSYVCTLDEEFVDIAGAYHQLDGTDTVRWYVGASTITTANDITVQLFPVRNK